MDALADTLERADRRAEVQIAAGAQVQAVLEELLLAAEVAAGGGMAASVLLVGPDGRQLRHAAAPSLPASYCAAIDGIEIGPDVGSCGTAAHLRRPVYVEDVRTDSRWLKFRRLAEAHGIRACWSTPLLDAGGGLVGTFALYNYTPRAPTRAEMDAIDMIAQSVLAAVCRSRENTPAD